MAEADRINLEEYFENRLRENYKKDYDLKLYNWIKDKDSKGCSFAVSGSLSHDGKSCLLLDMLIEDGYTCVEFEYDYNKVSRVGKKETKEVLIKNY